MSKPKKTIHGYDGPSGAYAVVNGRFVALADDPAAITALATSAMLTGLGASAKAAEFESVLGAIRVTA